MDETTNPTTRRDRVLERLVLSGILFVIAFGIVVLLMPTGQ